MHENTHHQDLHEHRQSEDGALKRLAANATLHCLTGCAIGEISGLLIGAWLGLSTPATIALAIALAFVFGFALSTLPLIKHGLTFFAALSVVTAADTLSIATMEIVDNAVMVAIPGAMEARVIDPILWLAMPFSLAVAFVAAYPVNLYLLRKGKGHALVMPYHGGHH